MEPPVTSRSVPRTRAMDEKCILTVYGLQFLQQVRDSKFKGYSVPKPYHGTGFFIKIPFVSINISVRTALIPGRIQISKHKFWLVARINMDYSCRYDGTGYGAYGVGNL